MPQHTASSAPPAHAVRSDIEGLRAVAVGTVVAFHVGIPGFSGGFVGVDIFFVISGFLITSLLLRELGRTGTISLPTFYARRARRLLPAATLVIAVTAVAAFLIRPVGQRADLGIDTITATLYVINWSLAARSVNYLDEDAVASPMQHFWSLAVEEQFYIVWPALILLGILLARRAGWSTRRTVGWMLTLVALASFVASVTMTASDPARAYFVSTTRLWELAIGALLAFGVERAARLADGPRQAMAWAGLAAILASVLVYSTSTAWPGSAALLPTVGTALVIAGGVRGGGLAGRVLSLRPLVWVGGLSYAIYLWHWPLLQLAEDAWPDIRLRHKIALGLASVALAWLTKHLVEDPVRFAPALQRRARPSLVLAVGLALATVSMGIGIRASLPELGRIETAGAASLVSNPSDLPWQVRSDPATTFTASGPIEPPAAIATTDIPGYYADDCQVDQGDPKVNLTCSYGVRDGAHRIALLGDSKMGQWFDAVVPIAAEQKWRIDLYLKSACAFTLSGDDPDCNAFGRNVLAAFADDDRRPDVALISSGAGTDLALQKGMSEAIRRLQALGTEVVLVQDNLHPTRGPVYECVEKNPNDYSACAFLRPKASAYANLLAVSQSLTVPLVDLNTWICPMSAKRCPAVIGGTLLYRQGSHLTATYVRTLSPVLRQELAGLGLGSISLSPAPVMSTDG